MTKQLLEPKNRSLPNTGVQLSTALQFSWTTAWSAITQQARSKCFRSSAKSAKFRDKTSAYRKAAYTFERLTRSGRRHPKVRIRTAVRHLSSPVLNSHYEKPKFHSSLDSQICIEHSMLRKNSNMGLIHANTAANMINH